MDEKRGKIDLEKRVKAYRTAMGTDYLGATFIELLLRLSEPDVDLIEVKANTYAFYVQLMSMNLVAAHFFNMGLIAALQEDKEGIDNG
ncbi:MAG: hypothetical protein IKF58_00920 [Bacillus sp. (in: Bacteria)]|nr:hypothetical protein [Bacillus sp. (in: firmicutes)]